MGIVRWVDGVIAELARVLVWERLEESEKLGRTVGVTRLVGETKQGLITS